VVNATALGREPGEPGPVAASALAPGAVVVDLVYGRQPTVLAREARERGLTVVDGLDVLLAQAVPQFALLTGSRLPLEVGRRALGLGEEG
jgi:shikimate 5-dehydrogenase